MLRNSDRKKLFKEKKVAYAQIGAIWEFSPKHPRDPFLDFGLIYYIVCVFLSATFSSLFAHLSVHLHINTFGVHYSRTN